MRYRQNQSIDKMELPSYEIEEHVCFNNEYTTNIPQIRFPGS